MLVGETPTFLHESASNSSLMLLGNEWGEVARWKLLSLRLTVVCVDEMRCLRGVVDELNLANLPHLDALVTEFLQHTGRHKHSRTHASNDGKGDLACAHEKLSYSIFLKDFCVEIFGKLPNSDTFVKFTGNVSFKPEPVDFIIFKSRDLH